MLTNGTTYQADRQLDCLSALKIMLWQNTSYTKQYNFYYYTTNLSFF